MTVRIISTAKQLRALEPAWARLLALSPSRDAFQTHGWMELWFEHFGATCEMFVLAWEHEGEVSAIAPFVISSERRQRMLVRVLRFPLKESAGPLRCDLLLGAMPEIALDALVGFLNQQRSRWDIADLSGIRMDGPTSTLLANSAQRAGWVVEPVVISTSARYIPVEIDWEAYLRSRSQHFRKRLRQQRTRLDRVGTYSFRRVDTRHDLSAALDSVREILQKRYNVSAWSALPSEDQETLHFFESLCKRFARAGMLDLRLLEIEGQPVACLISLIDAQKVYPLLTKYDPAFEAVSPGRAVISSLCADALKCGYREIDFLSDWDYLHRFTDHKRDFARVILRHRGWRARLTEWLEFAARQRKSHSRSPIDSDGDQFEAGA